MTATHPSSAGENSRRDDDASPTPAAPTTADLTSGERAVYQSLVARGMEPVHAREEALDGVDLAAARRYGHGPRHTQLDDLTATNERLEVENGELAIAGANVAAAVRAALDTLARWQARGHTPECPTSAGQCERCAKATGASALAAILPTLDQLAALEPGHTRPATTQERPQ